MNPIYNLAVGLYEGAVRVAAVRNPKAVLMVRGRKTPLTSLPAGRWAWFHAASLGEFEQGRPMMEMLKRERPDMKILLTFFSPSGYEVRKNYPGADVVAYMPFDSQAKVKEFLDAAHPEVAVFIKYEFWGNYLQELKRRGIPVFLISGIFRKSQIFFRPYGGMMRGVLKCFKKIFVQDNNSRLLLRSIGVDNVEVTGDTRHDRVAQIAAQAAEMPRVEDLMRGAEMKLVIGSSWPADEEHYIPWLKAHPQVKAIVAPHEFDAKRLEMLRNQLGVDKTVLLSELDKGANPRDYNYLIIDCFGKLSSLYRYGDCAYVGGGFGVGIHNIVEAAVYGIPVIFGPKHEKFREASGLIECGGGYGINNGKELAQLLDAYLASPARIKKDGEHAGEYVKAHTGATAKMFPQIFS